MTAPPETAAPPAEWIGRTETVEETVAPEPLMRWAATLEIGPDPASVGPGTPLPPVAHWAYFRGAVPNSGLLDDGHSEVDGLLPSDPAHPRRMWAGGALQFHAPLRVGDSARRVSVVDDVVHKEGRSGSLLFVTLRHRIERADGTLLIDERQDMVRRAAARPGDPAPEPKPAPDDPAWREERRARVLTLFRYSAVTFNGHRIHYDRDYARDVERYPALVVHGPMLATYLADLAERRSGKPLATFDYRATAPVFEDETFSVNGTPTGTGAELFCAGTDGRLAMTAAATFTSA